MYSKINYTIVGIFVLLFGLGMVLFSFWLAKYGLHQEYDLYKTYMTESVAGLSKDSVVRLRGVDVGRVKEIRIDPQNIERVEILLNIKKGVPIKEDMVAHMDMLGVTGLLSVEIEGGTNSARTLHPSNNVIPVIRTEPSWINKTKQDIGKLSDKIVTISTQIEKLLSNENLKHIGQILGNADEITYRGIGLIEEINATVTAYRRSIEQISQDANVIAHSFKAVSDKTVPTVRKLMETTRNFNRLTLKVEKSLERGDYNFRKILEPLLVNIEMVSNQLSALAKGLNESPNDILFKSRRRRKGPGE